MVDNCGDCTGPNTPLLYNQHVDCTGVCYGPYQTDSCGVCQEPDVEGGIFENRDCNDTCFGQATTDGCGVCYGGDTGLLVNSTLDACSVCSGDNTTCVACNGVVASELMVDTCGDCGGNGCGCFKIDSITPNTGPRTGGTEVVIKGAGLFLNDSTGLGFTFDRDAPNCGAPFRFPITDASILITCLFREANSGEQRQAFAIPVNQTTVRCITESTTLEAREYFVQVRVANGPFSNPIPFFYEDFSAIRVDQLSPTSALIKDSNAVINFIGSNFLNISTASCLIYNFQRCFQDTRMILGPRSVPAVFLSSSQYLCVLPEAAVPCQVTIRLSLDGQESGNLESTSTDFSFTYRHSAPEALAVFFSRDMSSLIVEFDRSVKIADSAPITCFDVFSQETFNLIGGFTATCTWTDNRQRGITIYLPTEANVTVNSSIVFKNGAVETNGSEFSFAVASTTVHAVSSHNAVQPEAVIDGPSSIPTCGEFTFSAIHSQFPGYKDFEYHWSIFVEDINTVDGFDIILDYLDGDSLGTSANSITLDSSHFLPNVVYNLQLSVMNSAGIESKAQNVNLTKESTVQYQVYILGSEVRKIYHGEDITLQAQVFLPGCFSSVDQNVFEYTWKLMKTVDQRRSTQVEVNTAAVHTLSPLVTFPSHLFEQNMNYTIQLTATVSGQRAGMDEVALEVFPSDVSAVIAGGNRTVAQHRVIVLDARKSIVSPFLALPKFTWICDIVGSQDACYNQSNSSFPVPIFVPNASFVVLPASDLEPGQFYQFSLILEQGAIVSRTRVVIETILSPAPIVEIVNANNTVLSTQEIWLQGVVYSLLPISRAYWESIQLGQGYLDLEDATFVQSQTVYLSSDIPTTTAPLASSPDAMVTINRVNRVNLVISPNVLIPGLEYTFRLTAVSKNGNHSYAEISITASSPPRLLLLTGTPSSDVAMETLYTLVAARAVDEPMDTPLHYQFGFIKLGVRGDLATPISEADVQWFSGVQVSPSITTLLPSGDPAVNHSLTLVVRAFDRDGCFADAVLNVTVEPRDGISSTVQLYSGTLSDFQESLSATKEWSEVLSKLTSAITESNKYEHLRSVTLKQRSLRLFLDIFNNHLPPSNAHYKLAASLLEQITAYNSITSPSDQQGIIAAVNTIIEWFRGETKLIETMTAPAQQQGSGEPLLLRTPYQPSSPPALSEATAAALINIYLNMLREHSLL